jgi:hypothetical protein
VINTIAIPALPTGNTLYKAWFGQKPPTDFLDYKESACCTRAALGAIGATGGITESSASGDDGEDREDKENREDSFFVNKEAEQKEVAEEMILSELTRRVTVTAGSMQWSKAQSSKNLIYWKILSCGTK